MPSSFTSPFPTGIAVGAKVFATETAYRPAATAVHQVAVLAFARSAFNNVKVSGFFGAAKFIHLHLSVVVFSFISKLFEQIFRKVEDFTKVSVAFFPHFGIARV